MLTTDFQNYLAVTLNSKFAVNEVIIEDATTV